MPTSEVRRRSMELATAAAVQRANRVATKVCAVRAEHGRVAMGGVTCGRCQLVQAYGAESAEVAAFDAVREEAGR